MLVLVKGDIDEWTNTCGFTWIMSIEWTGGVEFCSLVKKKEQSWGQFAMFSIFALHSDDSSPNLKMLMVPALPVFCYATCCCCCIMREILWSGSNTHGLPPSRIPTIWRDTKSQKATRPQWSEALGSGGRNSSRVDDGALSRPLRSISPFPIVI